MIKTVENILKQSGIEEYQAEAKLIVLELSAQQLEDFYDFKVDIGIITNLTPEYGLRTLNLKAILSSILSKRYC